MGDYLNALEKNLFESEGSRHKVMLDLVLAVAKFENAKAGGQEIGDDEMFEIQRGVKKSLKAVYALGIQGQELASCMHGSIYFYNSRVRRAGDVYIAIADIRNVIGEIDSSFGKNSSNFALNFVNAYRKYISLMEKARFGSLSAIETRAAVNAKKEIAGHVYNLQELNVSFPMVARSIAEAVKESNQERYIPPFTNMPAIESRAINVALQYIAPVEILKQDKVFNESIMNVVNDVCLVDLYLRNSAKNAVHRKLLKEKEDDLKKRIHRIKTNYPNDGLVREGVRNACDYFNQECIPAKDKKVDSEYILNMIYPNEGLFASSGSEESSAE